MLLRCPSSQQAAGGRRRSAAGYRRRRLGADGLCLAAAAGGGGGHRLPIAATAAGSLPPRRRRLAASPVVKEAQASPIVPTGSRQQAAVRDRPRRLAAAISGRAGSAAGGGRCQWSAAEAAVGCRRPPIRAASSVGRRPLQRDLQRSAAVTCLA